MTLVRKEFYNFRMFNKDHHLGQVTPNIGFLNGKVDQYQLVSIKATLNMLESCCEDRYLSLWQKFGKCIQIVQLP